MRLVVIVSLLCCLPGVAYAQAFGVTMGTPKAAYGDPPWFGSALSYRFVVQVPQPNPYFDFYIALIPKEQGTCSISGYTNPLEGQAAVDLYDVVDRRLRETYGVASTIKQVPETFAVSAATIAGLNSDEPLDIRHLWDHNHGGPMPHDLKSVSTVLSRDSKLPHALRVSLHYVFSNFDSCPMEVAPGNVAF